MNYEIRHLTDNKYSFTILNNNFFKPIDEVLNSLYKIPKDKINIVNNLQMFRTILERYIVDKFVNDISIVPNQTYLLQVVTPDDKFVLYLRDNQDVENELLSNITFGTVLNENLYIE